MWECYRDALSGVSIAKVKTIIEYISGRYEQFGSQSGKQNMDNDEGGRA